MNHEEAILNLSPVSVWKHFSAISAIPRCSKAEAAVRDYVVTQANSLGLSYRTDAAGNVVVRKPASVGMESRPSVALQGHLDMVCEKNMGTEHDFGCDPISLVLDGQWLRADGTTLGADNGIAVAMMLAILEGTYKHPALECLFTVDEETGLCGALGLDAALLQSRLLINIDSEEDDKLVIGCAGGRNTYADIPIVRESPVVGSTAYRLSVLGLRGGHSGVNIHEERGNALVLGARLLQDVLEISELRIASVHGGDKHNAIPREFVAVVAVPAARAADLESRVKAMGGTFAAELGSREPGLRVSCDATDTPETVITPTIARSLVRTMVAMPNGVLGMSHEVPGLVETSTNLAAVRTEDQAVTFLTSQRSSRASLIEWAARKVAAAFELGGAQVRFAEGYPSWTPNPSSALLGTAKQCYAGVFGREADIVAFHAGLECGVIGGKIPGMDMISLGPNIEGAHTPDERVDVVSTDRMFNFLIELLAQL